MGGGDESTNLVMLLPEEHFLAHLLLVKIHPSEFKLWYAANMMQNRVKSNKEYGWFRRKFAKINSRDRMGVKRSAESISKQRDTIAAKMKSGYHHPNRGRSLTDEHKQKISDSNTNKSIPIKYRSSLEGYVLRYGDAGIAKYNEDCKKKDSMSITAFIKRYGDQEGRLRYATRQAQMKARKRESNPFFGKTHSSTSKDKMRASALARPKITCPHCARVGSAPLMKRWHFDKCKEKI